jgi:DNA-binding transcriptional ArsR family regulator
MAATRASKASPVPKLKDIVRAFGSVERWRIFVELGKGEPLPTGEIARRVGLSRNGASKLLSQLRKCGLLERGFGNLYRVPARFCVAGQPALDFGAVVMRLDYADGEPAH